MGIQFWAVFPAAFFASAVEFVEAFTIVLVVGVTINWRSAIAGGASAMVVIAVLIGALGVALVRFVPIDVLRLVVGVLLLLFGLKWLKKAILRYARRKAVHDEEAIYEAEHERLRARGAAERADAAIDASGRSEPVQADARPGVPRRFDPFGFVTAFKSVLLEGLEVAFIVITFGAQVTSGGGSGSGIGYASAGAAAAFVLVVVVGAVAKTPLQRVPENTLKFIVGIMLTTFGTFWGGEGIGIAWWGGDSFLVVLGAGYLGVCGLLVAALKAPRTVGAAG